ncbi:unnamed protein product [Echinostoma caproni]|uniref:Uncharacterized protein n=1 Tax=Echinostoma caproni TaxID=27848 RepID=A0A183AEQ9_9TREM|nr:unnamed protein product [Echinostoma caproni]
MFNSHVCLTHDTNFVQTGASESTSDASTLTDMGNCALCEDKLHESEETEPLCLDQSTTFPNSYSYPLFYNPNEFTPTFPGHMTYQRTFAKSCSLSSIAPGFKTNFSPSYLDCRLRYIRQTRRIQKYLRITPEGHLLVNDVKQYTRLGPAHGANTHSSSDKINQMNCDTFHPLSSLISVTKLRRIHAAYWNLESRQDLLRSRSATVQELASESSKRDTQNDSPRPLEEEDDSSPETSPHVD